MRAFVGLLFISVVLCGLDMDSCIYKGDKTYDLSQLSGTYAFPQILFREQLV